MATEVWSKTPPSEAGWYWFRMHATYPPEIGYYEPTIAYGESRVWSHERIPSPTALAAMEECCKVLRAVDPECVPTGGGDFETMIVGDVTEWAELRDAALARLDAATGEDGES